MKNIYFGLNFRKTVMLVKIFEKSRFWSKFLKNSDFDESLAKISISVKILKYLDFRQNFKKSRFWSKFAKTPYFGQNCAKSRLWLIFWKNFRFQSKFSEYLDFNSKFLNKSILVKISEKSGFLPNVKFFFEKSWFWSKFSKKTFDKKLPTSKFCSKF